jgi:hypothetical protein
MGWQDAPLVTPGAGGKAAWESAPLVGDANAKPGAPAAQPKQDLVNFTGGNLSKGVADVVGLPVDLANSAVEGTKGLINKVAGTHLKQTENPVGGSDWIKQQLAKVGSITPDAEPRTPTQKVVAAGLEAAPAAAIPGGGAKALPRLGAAIGGGAGGEVGRQIGGVPGQIAGSLVGGGMGGMAGAERGIPKPPTEAARASQASGIPLTIGQETGNKAVTSVENRLRELFPSKGTAHADELAQVTAGAQRVDDLASQMSQVKAGPELIGNELRTAYGNTVRKIGDMRDTQAAKDYAAVKAVAGDKPIIRYDNTFKVLDQIIAQNKGVPGGDAAKIASQAEKMRKQLSTQAGAEIKRQTADLNPMAGAAGKAFIPPTPGVGDVPFHTIDEAMKTRRFWGQAAARTGNVFSDVDPNVNQMMAKRLFGAINRDFEAASTSDTPIAKTLKTANQNYAKSSQSIDFIKKSALGKLLGEDVTDAAFSGQTASTKAPEAIAKRYLSMSPSEARSVTSILQQHDPDVLNDVKAFVLRNGLEAAKNDAPGAPPISFGKFRKEMEKVQPKLEEMGFTKKEIADIKDVTDTMARAGDKAGANPSGTSAALHMGATGAAAFAHPGAALASIITPYVASKALLTQPGRELLRKAYNASNTKAQQAAIGALRAQFAQPSQSGATNQPTGTQLASPPQ